MTANPDLLERLEARLREDHDRPGRAYHNFAHVEDCLQKLAEVTGLASVERRLLRYAILWHDSVYDPTRSDNEERSAERAAHELAQAGESEAECAEIARLILLTKGHEVSQQDRLGALLVSIDLSILGSEPERYRAYATAIRHEYAHVPEDAFRIGRSHILQRLLSADPIYPDPGFRARYEAKARANMAAELAALSPDGHSADGAA